MELEIVFNIKRNWHLFHLMYYKLFYPPPNKKIKMTKQSLTTPPVFVVSSPRVFCQGQIEESKACWESPPGKTSIQADD